MQQQMISAILADDEVAVVFADGGMSCGKDGGMGGGTGGGRGCDRPSQNPQDGCKVIGKIRGYGPTAEALCNAGGNAIRAGQARTENAINGASGVVNGKSKSSKVLGDYQPKAWGRGGSR